MPDALLTTPDGKPGLKAEYNEGMTRGRPAPGASTKPIASRIEPNVNLTDTNLPPEIAGKKDLWRAVVGIPHAHRVWRFHLRDSRRGLRKAYGR